MAFSSRSRAPRPPRRARSTWLPGVAVLTAAGFLVGAALGGPPTLRAATGDEPSSVDSDHDGLATTLEKILRLNPESPDTDRDGFFDAEECARGSDPRSARAVPEPAPIHTAVEGYFEDGFMHVVLLVYLRGGVQANHSVQFGIMHRGRAFILPPSVYLPYAEVHEVTAQNLLDVVECIDISIPEGSVLDMRSVSFFAVVTPGAKQQTSQADALNVVVSGNVPFQVGGAPSSTMPGGASKPAQRRGSSVLRPLIPEDQLPANSTAGQICVQQTRVAGSQGPGMTLEVSSASCQMGDGTCPPTCITSVGTSFEVLDPVILIGG